MLGIEIGRRGLAVLVAGLMAAAPARAAAEAPPTTAAPAADDAPRRAELVIEAELGDASAVVVDRVRVRGEALLRQREVLPGRGAADPQIRIRIEPIGDEPGYRCHFGAWTADAVVPGSDGTSLCKLCTEAELVDHVEAAIERVVPRIPVEAAPVVAPAPVAPPPGRAPLSVLGKAGIGVLAAGVAATIAGAVIVTRPTKVQEMGLSREQTEFRTPGLAVLGIGVAVAIAGLALVAVDRHRARRRGGSAAWRGGPVGRF